MILRLVREQLRSQWRYTAWSAGLLAFALALSTYAMFTGATVIAHLEKYDDFNFWTDANYGAVVSVIEGDPANVRQFNGRSALSLDDLTSLIGEALAEGPVTAGFRTDTSVEGYRDSVSFFVPATPVAFEPYLETGAAPEHGEIVVSVDIARALGVGPGDPIVVESVREGTSVGNTTFIISGTLKTGFTAPYWNRIPDAVTAPSDFESVAEAYSLNWYAPAATDDSTRAIVVDMTWRGSNGALAPYADPYWGQGSSGLTLVSALTHSDQAGYWTFGAAGVTVLGMMIAAFGMGRAQAEARTKWAATARVLGATRRTIAASSIIETALVSLAGIALGLAAGIGATAIHTAWLRATHPEALLPAGPSIPSSLLLAAAGIGIAIASVVAAIPAFWTARVAPVAALKPVTPIGEATVSRNVSIRWPIGILVGAGIVCLGLFWSAERTEPRATWISLSLLVALVAIVASAAALVLEGARELVRWLGTRLSRSRQPWLIAAGDGLSAHRRIFTFASLAMLSLTAAFAWFASTSAIGAINDHAFNRGWGELPLPAFDDWWNDQLNGGSMVAQLALVAGVITFVAVIVTLSSRATFAADAATRAALGLNANGERIASAARQWGVMGTAGIVGGMFGWAATLLIRLGTAALSPNYLVYSLHWNVTVAVWGLAATAVVIAVTLAVSLAGSLAVGLLARPRTPVDALRRAAG